jgi:hypothetical protein
MAPRPTTTTKTYDTILLLIQMCIFEGLFAGKRFRLLSTVLDLRPNSWCGTRTSLTQKVSGHR